MTIAELRAFIGAASRRHALERIDFITGVAIGAQGSGKAIKKMTSNLSKMINSED